MTKQDAIYVDDLYDDNLALRAEVERWKAGYQEYRELYDQAGQRAERAEAKIERLRSALEKIEAGYSHQRLSAAELASIARQAL